MIFCVILFVLAAGACVGYEREIQAIMAELERPKTICAHKTGLISTLHLYFGLLIPLQA